MAEFMAASRGVGAAGLTTGIIGTALGVLNGGIPNLLGGMGAGCNTGCGGWNRGMPVVADCSDNQLVNRYEANMAAKIADLETEVKLRDANTFTMNSMNSFRNYVDERFNAINGQLCAQAVHNQRTEDSFALAQRDLAAVKSDLDSKIKLESERRCCADNSIVNYANATFYPKLVADVTAATTTTAQTLYNPIPDCGCCNG